MFQWILKKIRKNNKGFTLIELVVVIAILGVLALIAVPKLTTSKKAAVITAHNANVKTLENAASMYIAEEGTPAKEETWKGVKEEGKWENYLQEWPKVPKGGSISNEGQNYEVTISEKGNITVIPGRIDVEE